MAQAQFKSLTFAQGHFRSYKATWVFAHNVLQKRDRAIQIVSLCTARQYGPIDTDVNLLWSPLNLQVT